jgi:hypothetical protein
MTSEKKNPYDRTSAKRATTYLQRLEEKKGKRLPIDFHEEHLTKIKDLIDNAGPGATAAGVIREAIDQAHLKLVLKITK